MLSLDWGGSNFPKALIWISFLSHLTTIQVDSEYRCVFLKLALSAKVPISVSENIIGSGLQCLLVSCSPEHPSHGCFRSQCSRLYSCTIPNDSREFVPHSLSTDSFMYSVLALLQGCLGITRVLRFA